MKEPSANNPFYGMLMPPDDGLGAPYIKEF